MCSSIARRRLLKGAAAAWLMSAASSSRGSRRTQETLDVVVVGAGLSGLTAARDLAKAGLDKFLVLEARDRVGGRTLNAEIGSGAVVELGGQWFGRTQTAVIDLARELDIELFRTYDAGTSAFVFGGQIQRQATSAIVDRTLSDRIDAMAREVSVDTPWSGSRAAELDAMTYQQWLNSLGLPQDQLATVQLGARLTYGATPDKLSLLWVLFYARSAGSYAELEGAPGSGAQEFRVVGGTQRLSTTIASALGSRVRLNAPVVTVRNWNGVGPCELVTSSGTLRAKRVILALSPSQANQIAFDPPLPSARAELQKQWPAAVDALKSMVVYPTPFWRNTGLSGQSYDFEPDGVHQLAWDNSPPDGRVGVIGAFISQYGSSLTADARKAALVDEYVKSFGSPAAQPVGYYEHQWLGESYTRGCISPLAPNVLSRLGSTLRPGLGCIEWAGTETATIWNGYLDGAVRAGREAALRVLREI